MSESAAKEALLDEVDEARLPSLVLSSPVLVLVALVALEGAMHEALCPWWRWKG